MPLYEYECTVCGHRFEVIQTFAAAPIATCPNCSGPVEKLASAPAVHFKGTGWYVTDYARKNSADASTAATERASEQARMTGTAGPSETGEKSGKPDTSEKTEKAAKTEKPDAPKSAESSKAPASGGSAPSKAD